MKMIAALSLAALMLGMAFAQSTSGSQGTTNPRGADSGKHTQGSTGTGKPTPPNNPQGKKPLPHVAGGTAPVGSSAKLPIKTPPAPSANQGSSPGKNSSTKKPAPSSPGGPPAASGPNSPGLDNFAQHIGQPHPLPSTGKQPSAGAHPPTDADKFGSQPGPGASAGGTPKVNQGHKGNKKAKECDAGPGCGPSPAPQKQ